MAGTKSTAPSPAAFGGDDGREAKKTKVSSERSNDDYTSSEPLPPGFVSCQNLLLANPNVAERSSLLPASLLKSGKTRNSIDCVKALFDTHGFRTAVIQSPRAALSIYKDSCYEDVNVNYIGKRFLLTMLGMHPDQTDMERWYLSPIKNIYCLFLFCKRIRTLCPTAATTDNVADLLVTIESLCFNLAPTSDSSPRIMDKAQDLAASVPKRVAQLNAAVVKADSRLRIEQLEHEFERLALWNSTFANATLQLFLDGNDCCIQSIYFKRSHESKYERITIYLYDPEVDVLKPPRFTFLPSLRRALEEGPKAIANDMIRSFWQSLLRHGYFATGKIKEELTPRLTEYFLSGITAGPTIPLLLNSHFNPTYPLSFYLHGKAGVGKSSLVRHFSPALNAAIEQHVDPELMVRFVKQNLNKPMNDLRLELELRPNNNDLSVMSIIQGRRMTMSQTKPGLVVIDMEEMASNAANANPNQLETTQLLSQRFSGRNSDYKGSAAAAPRNSTKRGISGDASLIVLFTSNYDLDLPCQDALKRLNMFANLQVIKMSAVEGVDRIDFAHSYMNQCVQDRFSDMNTSCDVDLAIPFGNGDTRPLVRHLRMLAFFVCALVDDSVRTKTGTKIEAKIVQRDDASHLCTVSVKDKRIDLRVGTMDNLFPVTHQIFDDRTANAMQDIRKNSANMPQMLDELSQIIDFWFARTLAPAVVVSKDGSLISALVEAVSNQHGVHSIQGVQAGSYKMMKSLYDKTDTPNLRDDILSLGKGEFVAIELQCPSIDAQLCIREIIEDSPSMTAFSSQKSALYKTGLIFFVHIGGEHITPEVESRASLIL